MNERTMDLQSKHLTSMRIALVTETFTPEVNGVAMTLGRITEGLLRLGHTLQIIRPSQSSSDSPNKRTGQEDVLVTGFPIPFYNELRFGFPSENRLVKLWQQKRPDVVHVATEGPLGLFAINVARKLRIPVTSSFHTNFQNYSSHYGIGFLRGPIEVYMRWLHNRTMATLAPTHAMVQTLQARGYLNVALFSRGVAIELFSPIHRSSALRESWAVNDQDIVVLYVGRLAKEKNVNLVLRSFLAIKSRHPNAKLVFVGDGPLAKSLQEECPDAIFAGMKTGKELAAHYASGDLFLFPSATETFGNVVPEALASGLAVVAYDYAAAATMITNEVNGCLVPFGDEAGFVSRAWALASAPHKLLALRQQAAPSVSHLDWGSVCEQFAGALAKVVKCPDQQWSTSSGQPQKNMVIQPSALGPVP